MNLTRQLRLAISVVICAGAFGCHTPPKPRVGASPPPATAQTVALRNNCYSLLYDLMSQEQHVSKLLIIKRDSPELNRLIKDISRSSAFAVEHLKAYQEADPMVVLDALDLPAGEVATREAIGHTKRNELLGSSGIEFERALLLTQVQALNYAIHLAVVAANHDTNSERRTWLNSFTLTMQTYQVRCLELLKRQSLEAAHLDRALDSQNEVTFARFDFCVSSSSV